MPDASTPSGRRRAEAEALDADADRGRTAALDLLRISRPRFWTYLGGTYLVGFSFGAGSAAALVSLTFAVHVLYFLVPANVFLYGINDLSDEDTDRLNPKKGQREHRLRRDDRQPVRTAVALGALLGVALIALQTTWPARAFFAAFLVLGAAYSAPPARLKARPFLDFASNALYAMPGFLGFAQASGQLPPVPALLGAAGWTGAMHLISAVPDIEADRAAGLSTTATVLGVRGSLVLCTALWLIAAGSALALSGGSAVVLPAFVYPAISAGLLFAPERVGSVYWRFPWLNAVMGFGMFVLAASRWLG